MSDSPDDKFGDYSYVVDSEVEVEVTKESPDDSSRVKGIFKKIEEASREVQELRANNTVTFLGLICPIVCEEENRVQIIHGHTKIWIPRDKASRVLSGRKKEQSEKWSSIFVNLSSAEEKK